MALPSKMFKLKEWLTVPETARHLSIMFGEDVSEADVLQLALDRHLILSVNFVNGVSARAGGKFLLFEKWEENFRNENSWEGMKPMVGMDKKLFFKVPSSDVIIFPPNECNVSIIDSTSDIKGPEELKKVFLRALSSDQEADLLAEMIGAVVDFTKRESEKFGGKVPPGIISFKEKISSISDIWDLPMMGNERIYIENRYQQLTGGPSVTGICIDGVFVEGADGEVWQIQERFDENGFCCKLDQQMIADGSHKNYLEEMKKKPYSHPDNYFPAGGLPEDSVLVVRTSALSDLLERLVEEDEEAAKLKSTVKDEIGTKERGTWLKIMYLLAMKLADSNKSAYLKPDGSFNVSKFEDVLKNKVGVLWGTDDIINNSGHGLSNDNLKKIFDEAKILF